MTTGPVEGTRGGYRQLDAGLIAETARRLERRVVERFPDSGLARVGRELVAVVEQAGQNQGWLRRPIWPVRVGVVSAVALLVGVAVATLLVLIQLPATAGLTDMLQAIDAAVNDVVFLGIAIYFLASLETRLKRKRALVALHELRSMAHIIDMHQLTKDPERVTRGDAVDTASSPSRTLTMFELSRYLDYCSEMLSLLSKSAALYVQSFGDPITLAAVNEVEDLTSGLSRKIWQKIMIIDRAA